MSKLYITRLAHWLWIILLFLAISHLISQIIRVVLRPEGFAYLILEIFNMDNEISIATWFSILLFFTISIIALLLRDKFKNQTDFVLVSIFFLFLSLDEAATIHETILHPVSLGFKSFLPFFPEGWIIPMLILIGFFVPPSIRVLNKLTKQNQIYALLGVTALVLGILVEVLVSFTGGFDPLRQATVNYQLLTLTEESLETAGIILIATAFIYTLVNKKTEVSFK